MGRKKNEQEYYCYVSFNIFDKPLKVEDGGWAVRINDCGNGVEEEDIIELPFKEFSGNIEEIQEEISFDIKALAEHIKCIKKM